MKRASLTTVMLLLCVLLANCNGGPLQSTAPTPTVPVRTTSPAFVQAVQASCTQCSNGLPIDITVKAGDAIVVPFWFNAANVEVQVSDSNNDLFSLWAAAPTTDLTDSPAFLYVAQNVVGGATVVRLNFGCAQVPCDPQSGAPASVFAGALEYQNVSHGLDASITADDSLTQQTQGQVISSGAFTTHLTDELVFGMGMANFGLQPGSGWTARLGCTPSNAATGSAAGYFCFEEQAASQTGSYNATFPTDFSSAGGLGAAPTTSAPNGYGIAAFSIY